MQIVSAKCDKCHTVVPLDRALHFNVRTGQEMCPSGNGYISNYDEYDLCHGCLHEVVIAAFRAGVFRGRPGNVFLDTTTTPA